MNIDKIWLTTNLTEDELLMFYAVATFKAQYQYFDLDTLQAIRPRIFAQRFQKIVAALNDEGKQIHENLKNKILDFERSYIQ